MTHLFACFLALSISATAFANTPLIPEPVVPLPKLSLNEKLEIFNHYRYVDPKQEVPSDLLSQALLHFHQHLKEIKNQRYLTVIDYAQPSKEKRFYIIDMTSGKVWKTYTANGKGTEPQKNGEAANFGNTNKSKRSSVGLFLTRGTYYGKHGLSLTLQGISKTNSNALARKIVIHGANYVQDKPVVQGRSWGCPAVPMKYRDTVINMLKGGSLILASKNLEDDED
ncbi:MAG: murein L,D-transpeptidase catalytic domain family protein [Bdellovibrionota bacterium]